MKNQTLAELTYKRQINTEIEEKQIALLKIEYPFYFIKSINTFDITSME